MSDLTRSRSTPLAGSTAEGAATLRAVAHREVDRRLRDPDYLAARFVGRGLRLNALVHVPLLRGIMKPLVERILPGGYWYETTRTKAMDEVLIDELEAGCRQVVILGAGFDSRAHRFADRLAGVAVFEVDHPVTSALKRERVRAIFGDLPAHVNYVTVDFETQDMAERLADCGYDEGLRTLFIWSGVSMYITADAVEGVLRFVSERSGSGSAIAFDYIYREFLEGDDSYYGAAELRRAVERQGEPFRFGIPECQAEAFVAAHGLELERHHTAQDMPERFLTGRDGRIAGRIYECGGLCVARRAS